MLALNIQSVFSNYVTSRITRLRIGIRIRMGIRIRIRIFIYLSLAIKQCPYTIAQTLDNLIAVLLNYTVAHIRVHTMYTMLGVRAPQRPYRGFDDLDAVFNLGILTRGEGRPDIARGYVYSESFLQTRKKIRGFGSCLLIRNWDGYIIVVSVHITKRVYRTYNSLKRKQNRCPMCFSLRFALGFQFIIRINIEHRPTTMGFVSPCSRSYKRISLREILDNLLSSW